MRASRAVGLCALALLLSPACTVGDVAGNLAGNAVGGVGGRIARGAAGSIDDLIGGMQAKFSPEQEYYIGRAAAAEIIARYGLDPNVTNQEYVRLIGASIVELSGRLRSTYGGYHFAVLDDDRPNGWSAPGGYVFITRGALARARDEDEVAAILCHELAHVSLNHGETIILRGRQKGPLGAALGRIGSAAAGNQGVVRAQVREFGNLGKLITEDMGRSGYGHRAEFEADREAVYLLYDVGYDASALLQYMDATMGRSQGTWDTHPPAQARIAKMRSVVARYGGNFEASDAQDRAVRKARFERVRQGGAIDEAVEPYIHPVESQPLPLVPGAGP